jgi:hypothetical protein
MTTTVTMSPNSTGLKVIAVNLIITFPSGSSSGAAPLANFVANHSGYILITGPTGGGAYYYIQVVNPLAAQNETVPYPALGPLVIPISPGSITMSLSYRDYGDIVLPNTADLTIVYYYYPSGTEPPSSSSATSPSGLRLSLQLNATIINSGRHISLSANVTNLLNVEDNVTAQANWPINRLTDGITCSVEYPMGMAVVKGFYDQSNFSQVLPLFLFDPNESSGCPAIQNVNYYVFNPTSSAATPYPNGFSSVLMDARLVISGYWTFVGGSGSASVFHSFDPGVYTVIAGDEWGDSVILHFTVSQ